MGLLVTRRVCFVSWKMGIAVVSPNGPCWSGCWFRMISSVALVKTAGRWESYG